MLSSFFSKSKPINLILVGLFILAFYLNANYETIFTSSANAFLKEISILLLLLLSLFLINFISGKNELTGKNSYKIVLFGGFICMFSAALANDLAIAANLFILLALRRIVSLRTQRETIKKIFDASLWICIASLFYFWSFLFLILVYLGILFHVGHKLRNWLVPLVAVITVFSIATSVDLLLTNSFYTFEQWFQESNFDFSAYRNLEILLPAAFLLALTAWSSFFYVGIIQKISANYKSSLILILFFVFLALAVAVFAPDKDSSELIFFFSPLALVVTNYFQVMKDKWFKEILLLIIILLPIFLQVI